MNHVALVGIGAVIGTVGTKILSSNTAKKMYVKGLVAGMRVRDGVGAVIEEAKAQFDDVCAEAEYEREQQREAEGETADVEIVGAKDIDGVEDDKAEEDNDKPAKSSAKTSKASKSVKSSPAKKATSSKK